MARRTEKPQSASKSEGMGLDDLQREYTRMGADARSRKSKQAHREIAAGITPELQTPVPETDEDRQLRYMIDNLDGDTSYISRQSNYYLMNLMKHTKPSTRTGYMVCHAVETSLEIETVGKEKVKFPVRKAAATKENYYKLDQVAKKKVDPRDWKTLENYFAQDCGETDFAAHDSTYRNLMRLADILHLNPVEKDCLKVLYVMGTSGAFSSVVDGVFRDDLKQTAVGFARMMDRPQDAAKIFNALHFTSRLATYGILTAGDNDDEYGNDDAKTRVFGVPGIDLDLIGSLEKPDMTDEEIVGLLLGKERKSDLEMSDFAHLGDQLNHVIRLIKTAVENGAKGINILLHGPAGSGKTELAGALAKHLGLKLYAVGEEDEATTTMGVSRLQDSTGKKRMSHLSRSQALLRESRDAVLLFDEIEDLLIKSGDSKKAADTESKIGVNRMLEENAVVTIWTGNDPEKFHEAVRQRMAYSIFMDYPPTLVREKMWRRRLEMTGCKLPEQDVRDLARKYAAPPRMISESVRTALKTMGGGTADIEETLRAASKLAFGQIDGTLIEDPVPAGFNLNYLNADQDLHSSFNRLVKAGQEKKAFTLLIQDKPGLGAEDFLRLMAEELAMNPLECDVADLVAPHPMMPPAAKIKAAFAGAVDGRQFLILKGLENMVSDPKASNTKEWQDPLVSLMIKEALMHRLPLAATVKEAIKLPDHVDIVFSHHLKMRPITLEQGERIYVDITGDKMPQHLVQSLDGAAPEDLLKLKDILAKSANDNVDHERAAALLQRMKASRQIRTATTIGFTAS